VTEHDNSSFARARLWLLLILGGLSAFYVFALVAFDALPVTRESPTNELGRNVATETPRPVEVPRPQPSTPKPDPVELLRAKLADSLGRSNRHVPRLSVVALQGERLVVVWAINDNLTRGFVARSGQMDAAKILHAISEASSRLPFFSSVFLAGTFAMVDQFGNGSEDRVIRLTFSHSTMKKINWPRFNDRLLYDIADSSSVHPQFRVD